MPEAPKKTMAQTTVQGLRKEANKGNGADESKVNEWMNFQSTERPTRQGL